MYAGLAAAEPASKSICAIAVLVVGSLVVTGAVVGGLAYVAATQLGGNNAGTSSKQQQESLTLEQEEEEGDGEFPF